MILCARSFIYSNMFATIYNAEKCYLNEAECRNEIKNTLSIGSIVIFFLMNYILNSSLQLFQPDVFQAGGLFDSKGILYLSLSSTKLVQNIVLAAAQ